MNATIATRDDVEIRPHPGRQTEFLSSPADIVIYGGAAGGGKTWALLLEPLRHVHNPDFGAVILRRTVAEVVKEGGLWDEAFKLYPLLDGRGNKNEHQYRFPAGARITFSHIQHESTLEEWKSAQIPLLEFDQLETFTERQFFYMLSRNRSTCGVRPYVRATANPQPGWLADFLDWWIAEDGYADLSRVGKIRWFVRHAEKITWSDSRQELERLYPDNPPKSVTFIVATVFDNPTLLRKDPGYLSNLMALSLVDRERLLGDRERGGNWKIKPTAGKVFNRDWFQIVPAAPNGGQTVLFWDFAATEKELKGDDPDYTACVVMRQVQGDYYFLYADQEQANPAAVDRKFVNLSRQWAETCKAQRSRYRVRWERYGDAGKREARRMVKMLTGLQAKGVPPLGDKVERAKPLAAQAEAGNVYLVAGPWNEMLLEHLHNQPDWPHDDLMDAGSGAFTDLTAGQQMQSGSVDWHAQTQTGASVSAETPEAEIERELSAYEAENG